MKMEVWGWRTVYSPKEADGLVLQGNFMIHQGISKSTQGNSWKWLHTWWINVSLTEGRQKKSFSIIMVSADEMRWFRSLWELRAGAFSQR